MVSVKQTPVPMVPAQETCKIDQNYTFFNILMYKHVSDTFLNPPSTIPTITSEAMPNGASEYQSVSDFFQIIKNNYSTFWAN